MLHITVRAVDAMTSVPKMTWRTRLAITLAAAATFFGVGVGAASEHYGWSG